eukprot:scaffold659309_cov57-Prasinocladus_malaysianus.AAC.1
MPTRQPGRTMDMLSIIFLAAALAPVSGLGSGEGLSSGGVCGQPWHYDKEYVPDEQSDPEGYQQWLNDLTTTGFQPVIGGVQINAGPTADITAADPYDSEYMP